MCDSIQNFVVSWLTTTIICRHVKAAMILLCTQFQFNMICYFSAITVKIIAIIHSFFSTLMQDFVVNSQHSYFPYREKERKKKIEWRGIQNKRPC